MPADCKRVTPASPEDGQTAQGELSAGSGPMEIGELADGAGPIMRALCAKSLKIACAESCTGGLLAALLTGVEGCAHGFDRGVVVYTDQAKQDCLGVSLQTIAREGAVSAPVAIAMAEAMLANSRAGLAISITGFAGAGEPQDRPGLVYIGLARRGHPPTAAQFDYGQISRAAVRHAAIKDAYGILSRVLGAG